MNLRKIRQENNMSQKVLSEQIGVSQRIISYWESGKREMPVRYARKIGKIFHINWKDLYED